MHAPHLRNKKGLNRIPSTSQIDSAPAKDGYYFKLGRKSLGGKMQTLPTKLPKIVLPEIAVDKKIDERASSRESQLPNQKDF